MENSLQQNSNESNNKNPRWKQQYFKLALIAALVGGPIVYHQLTKDSKEKIENVLSDGFQFGHNDIPYRDNQEFEKGVYKENLSKGVDVKRDAWLTFYIIKQEDLKSNEYFENKQITKSIKQGKKIINKKENVKIKKIKYTLDLEKIRNKLSKLPEFKYLEREEYERSSALHKTKSFNVPKDIIDTEKVNHIKKGQFFIPIPLNSDNREISTQQFVNYAMDAINEIENHKVYGSHIQKLLKTMNKRDLVTIMLAFARSESTEEYQSFNQKIGSTELYRRENHKDAFSFTYYHILMEKNADGKTDGPGLKARKNLGLSEGECYHPKNAAKLFLGYRIEKSHQNLSKYFPIKDNEIGKIAKIYNGGLSGYKEKFEANYNYSKDLIDGKINVYTNSNLENKGFEWKGYNSKGLNTFRYIIKNQQSWEELQNNLINIFNSHKDKKCPKATIDNIVDGKGEKLVNRKVNPGDSVYILIK